MKTKQNNVRFRRHHRVRARVCGDAVRPRLSVYRSNKHLFLQLINDVDCKTIVSISDRAMKKKSKMTKSDIAYLAGKALAEKAASKNITSAVFDRGGYKYHGRVQKIAEGARDGGLIF